MHFLFIKFRTAAVVAVLLTCANFFMLPQANRQVH